MNPTAPRVAYFTIKYPTLSQTFLQREVETLRAQGIAVEVYPCWQLGPQPANESAFPSPAAPVHPLTLSQLWTLPWHGFRQTFRLRKNWPLAGQLLRRHRPRTFEGWFMTVWGTLYALHLAGRFASNPPDHFHGAWATGPATLAAVLARRFGKHFSFGAHAYDVYRDGGDPLLDPKLQNAAFIHTTTRQTEQHLLSRVPESHIILSRRGLPALPDYRQPTAAHQPVRLLSVGRLVEKKGHIHQLAACAALKKAGTSVELRLVGDGPLGESLQETACELGLQHEVIFCGAQPASEVSQHYRWADLFWHTGIVDSEGDRDGLPNVIPEAMAHGVPVISCQEAGALEAIEHEVTGLTVEVRDTETLVKRVQRLASDLELRRRLARSAREWVETHFSSERNTALLAEAFRQVVQKR